MCAMTMLAGSGVVIYHDLPDWQMPKPSNWFLFTIISPDSSCAPDSGHVHYQGHMYMARLAHHNVVFPMMLLRIAAVAPAARLL